MVEVKVLEAVVGKLLQEKFREEAYSDCFLVDLKMSGSKKIQVFIDRDSPVDFHLCRDISRYLEQHLDDREDIPDNYVLEVSSPGTGRPLTMIRQFHKHKGRRFDIRLLDGTKIQGKLSAVENEILTLLTEKKKGKKPDKQEVEVPFDRIEKAKVIVSFH